MNLRHLFVACSFPAWAMPIAVLGSEPLGYAYYSFPHAPCSEASAANDVNDRGIVVGYTQEPNCIYPFGFQWSNGRVYNLKNDYWDFVTAFAISENDVILGEGGDPRVVVWRNGVVTGMDAPAICASNGNDSPIDLSDNGAFAVGACRPPDGDSVGVRYDTLSGEAIDIPLLPDSGPEDSAEAYDVTNEGLVIGRVCELVGGCRGYYWYDGVLTELPNQLGGVYSTARAINNRGLIVGWAEDGNGNYWAMSFDLNTQLQKILGPGYGWDVNDRGQAFGYEIDSCCSTAIYVYDDGEVRNISSYLPPSWQLPHPDSINNYGWVTGWADDPNGNIQAWLLVPIYAKGDYDGDEDVDFQDFGKFQECFAAEPYQGPEGGLHVGCSVFDFDDDIDLDGDDFAAFNAAFTGPTAPDLNPTGPG